MFYDKAKRGAEGTERTGGRRNKAVNRVTDTAAALLILSGRERQQNVARHPGDLTIPGIYVQHAPGERRPSSIE